MVLVESIVAQKRDSVPMNDLFVHLVGLPVAGWLLAACCCGCCDYSRHTVSASSRIDDRRGNQFVTSSSACLGVTEVHDSLNCFEHSHNDFLSTLYSIVVASKGRDN